MARKLPTVEFEGKSWTVDERLGEFRFVVFGETPEFVPFDSEKGERILTTIATGSLGGLP